MRNNLNQHKPTFESHGSWLAVAPGSRVVQHQGFRSSVARRSAFPDQLADRSGNTLPLRETGDAKLLAARDEACASHLLIDLATASNTEHL